MEDNLRERKKITLGWREGGLFLMPLYVFKLIDMDGLSSAVVFDTVMAAENVVLARVDYLVLGCVA